MSMNAPALKPTSVTPTPCVPTLRGRMSAVAPKDSQETERRVQVIQREYVYPLDCFIRDISESLLRLTSDSGLGFLEKK